MCDAQPDGAKYVLGLGQTSVSRPLWVMVGHVDSVPGLVELEEGDRVQQAPGWFPRLEPLAGLGGG
eukprot:scaffold59996_cov44-Phaeocystis_antarctica.AAC.1